MLWPLSHLKALLCRLVRRCRAAWDPIARHLALAAILPVLAVGSCITTSRHSSFLTGEGCLELTPESALNPVRACSSQRYYHVQAGSKQHRYDKKWFHQALRTQIADFVRRNGVDPAVLAQATLEVWFQVPVFAPEQTKFVAVVLSPGGNFAVPLPLAPIAWQLPSDGALMLERAAYPSSGAYRSGRLVVQARNDVKPLDFHQFLSDNLADHPTMRQVLAEHMRLDTIGSQDATQNWPVIQLEIAAFSERKVASRLARAARAKDVLGDVSLLPYREPDGRQLRFISFPFRADDKKR